MYNFHNEKKSHQKFFKMIWGMDHYFFEGRTDYAISKKKNHAKQKLQNKKVQGEPWWKRNRAITFYYPGHVMQKLFHTKNYIMHNLKETENFTPQKIVQPSLKY